MEGLVFIHEKPQRMGRSASGEKIRGNIKKMEPGKFQFSCSMAKDVANMFTDKNKGFRVAVMDGDAYLAYVENGYRLSNYGKGSSRKAFSAVIHETPQNKMFFRVFADKQFFGSFVDADTIKLHFKEEK